MKVPVKNNWLSFKPLLNKVPHTAPNGLQSNTKSLHKKATVLPQFYNNITGNNIQSLTNTNPGNNTQPQVPKYIHMEENKEKETNTRFKEMVHRIEAVAKSIGEDFKLKVIPGDDWAYEFTTNTVTFAQNDLINKPEDYSIGVIIHEGAHKKYSRWLVEPEFSRNSPFLLLNNAVEDPRVNNIVSSRYAGAKDYFKRVYDEDIFNEQSEIKEKLIEKILQESGLSKEEAKRVVEEHQQNTIPKHIQYGLGVIYDWYTNGQMDPSITDDKVKRALEKTALDYRKAFEFKGDLLKEDLTACNIMAKAEESYKIVKERLWPVYKELLEEDKKDLASALSKSRNGPTRFTKPTGRTKPTRRTRLPLP